MHLMGRITSRRPNPAARGGSLGVFAALLAALALAALAAPPAVASLPAARPHVDVAEYASTATPIDVPMRNAEGGEMIRRMLNEEGFWSDAKVYPFEGQLYDEIRLKSLPEGGYLPMITGEADENIPHDVVADIVFGQQTALPKYMSGTVAVTTLGYGTDPKFGVPYLDNFFVLDLSFFYVTYTQRMYRRTVGDVTYLWFEKLDATFVDAATWSEYQSKIQTQMTALEPDLRSLFGSVLEVGQIYGVFVVAKGETRESRVTFVSKITFGQDAGWLAKLGSKMPPVLKAGLQSGFDASVKIAKAERDRRPK